jgi:phosphohistidine swiveling domain-containing protein
LSAARASLLVPALLTALVLDEKAIGVAVAAVALSLRVPVLVAVTLAVAPPP